VILWGYTTSRTGRNVVRDMKKNNTTAVLPEAKRRAQLDLAA